MKTITLSPAPPVCYTMPDLIPRDFWKAEVEGGGCAVGRDPESLQIIYAKNGVGRGFIFELCMLLLYQIHFTHMHIQRVIVSYLHTAGYAAQTEGRMIRCVQKKEECLHQKYAYLLINSADFRYNLKSRSYVHRELE